jgi:hypothetical protein
MGTKVSMVPRDLSKLEPRENSLQKFATRVRVQDGEQ